jgi:hypothetical protein
MPLPTTINVIQWVHLSCICLLFKLYTCRAHAHSYWTLHSFCIQTSIRTTRSLWIQAFTATFYSKHVEMHNLCHIDKDITLGYDKISQTLMDEDDVEGEPVFHAIERTMKNDTNRALFLDSNNYLCMKILNDIEDWMAHKLEHSNDPKNYRENEHVKAFSTTIEQRKSQQHVKFDAYAKHMVKKFYSSNPNVATYEFDYAPSCPEKLRISLLILNSGELLGIRRIRT